VTTIVVLFNLKPGVSRADYERWARESDLPVVNGLKSVEKFEVLRAGGLLGSNAKAPYEYVELIRVPDMSQFGKDVASELVQKGAAQFQQFADKPLFILAEHL
jgi:hypothetical protein